MKNLILIAYMISISLFAMSAHAKLMVVTKPLDQQSSLPSASEYDPVQNFTIAGLKIETKNGRNDCLMNSNLLHELNTAALAFSNHLQMLSESPDLYLLTCSTINNITAKVTIQKN